MSRTDTLFSPCWWSRAWFRYSPRPWSCCLSGRKSRALAAFLKCCRRRVPPGNPGRHSFGTPLFDGCCRHRQQAVDLVGYIAVPIGALHQNDADQVFSRVHRRVGTISAAFDEAADRVIAESAERLTHHLETKAVTHSWSKARFPDT